MNRLTLRADVGVGAIAVSPTSRDVALAGRSGLYVVDLYDPFALPRWLPLRNAWEVASVQWCPDPAHPAWVVSSSNQKVLVWNLELPSDQAVEHVLQDHRRAVTDISFSKFRLDQLATTSIDTSVCLWDLRQPLFPTMRFVDFSSGGIQVKASPTDENQLASAHNNRIVLWDCRWANKPVSNWVAHIGECNGIEFMANGKLLTCSTDRTIKLWDLTDQESSTDTSSPATTAGVVKQWSRANGVSAHTTVRVPELTVEASYPIWRAIPTPFELGALVVPLRGGENTVRLVNLARQTGVQSIDKITINGGHLEHPSTVKSASFMRTNYSPSQYDIVTWSNDARLREWKGGAMLNLPHASSAAGCKDDKPPPLPRDIQTYNTDTYDTLPQASNVYNHRRGVFELPVFNRRKDHTHCIAHLDWISGVKVDHTDEAGEAGDANRLTTSEGGADIDNPDGNDISSGRAKFPRRRSTVSSEELSQEIILVSMRMPKVNFEEINIWAGTCEINLMGPWGTNGEIVHIHASVRVPPEYPYESMNCRVVNMPLEVPLPFEKDEQMIENVSKPESDSEQADDPGSKMALSKCERSTFTEINQFLHDSCAELSRHGIRSLEFCVRYLVGDPVSIEDALASEHALTEGEASIEFGELEPLPRSSSDEGSEAFDVDFNEFEKLAGPLDDKVEQYETDGVENGVQGGERKAAGEEDVAANGPVQGPDVIDSTPVPKNCGAVWSTTGKLVCFFNQKAATKEKGPLPLDKIFADDSQSSSSEAPFLSDSDDFEHDFKSTMMANADWSLTAAQLGSTTLVRSVDSPAKPVAARITSNGRSIMNFTAPLDYHSNLISRSSKLANSHTLTSQNSEDVRSHHFSGGLATHHNEVPPHKVVINDFKHLWPSRPDLASEYIMNVNGCPLEMAKHNATVARKYKLYGDEHIWRLLINYIRSEEAAYADPLASMLSESPKFDWSGGGTGFRELLPSIAAELERRGNVQLLVGISSVLSSLRSRRSDLSMEAAKKRPPGLELTILEPNLEALFQLNKDGTASFIARRMTNSAFHGDTDHVDTWMEHVPILTPHISPFASTDEIVIPHHPQNNVENHPHRNSHHHRSSNNFMRPPLGPVMSIEIFDNEMFDYHPQTSSVYLRGLSHATENFGKWYSRLLSYRLSYSRLLHIWGLDIESAEVLKMNLHDTLVSGHQSEIKSQLDSRETQYVDVEMPYNHCSLCEATIVKTFEFCSVCSHAMHSKCAQVWWQTESYCPTACGCTCKDHAPSIERLDY